MIEETIVYTLRRIKMPLFRVAGNEIIEYEEEIEADTEEQAQDIFIKNIYEDKFDIRNAHSWQWHDTKEITDE